MVFHLLAGTLVLATAAWARRRTPRAALASTLVAIVWGACASLAYGYVEARGFMPFFSGAERAWTFGVVYVPALLLALASHRGLTRLGRAALLGAALLIGLVAVDATWIEPHALERRTERVEADVETPLRIAVVSDLQTDSVSAYEAEVVDALIRAQPDLVLFPGDYIQAGETYPREARKLARLLARVRPRLGAYAVQGDVEAPAWRELVFGGTSVTTFDRTTTVEAGPLTLTALSLGDSADASLVVPRRGRVHVAFGHRPDYSMGDVAADVLIAGHTHGGQVQLPFVGPLVTFSDVPRAHAAGGRFPLAGGRTLVVSRGLGMERGAAPRLRFLCRPELVFVDLVPRGQGGPGATTVVSGP